MIVLFKKKTSSYGQHTTTYIKKFFSLKLHYQDIVETIFGNTNENIMPEKIPVINIAAANIPAVTAYCGFTVCGAYIIPSELK